MRGTVNNDHDTDHIIFNTSGTYPTSDPLQPPVFYCQLSDDNQTDMYLISIYKYYLSSWKVSRRIVRVKFM